MNEPSQQETLTELKARYAVLIAEPFVLPEMPVLHSIRLHNQLTSVQVELLRFHKSDAQAMQLFTQLGDLATHANDLPPNELTQRLLALLRPAA